MDLTRLLEQAELSFHRKDFVQEGVGGGTTTPWTLLHAAFDACDKLDAPALDELDQELMRVYPDLNVKDEVGASTVATVALKISHLLRRNPLLKEKEVARESEF